jgi:hypothetical protein
MAHSEAANTLISPPIAGLAGSLRNYTSLGARKSLSSAPGCHGQGLPVFRLEVIKPRILQDYLSDQILYHARLAQ